MKRLLLSLVSFASLAATSQSFAGWTQLPNAPAGWNVFNCGASGQPRSNAYECCNQALVYFQNTGNQWGCFKLVPNVGQDYVQQVWPGGDVNCGSGIYPANQWSCK